MKNNILGALVIFFAVVACLLIIDDLSYEGQARLEFPVQNELSTAKSNENLATNDLEVSE